MVAPRVVPVAAGAVEDMGNPLRIACQGARLNGG
jgi:hypothetical protein